MSEIFNLESDNWSFKLSRDVSNINAGFNDHIPLPSTVSQQKKPPATDEQSDGFLTDPFHFEGYAPVFREFSDNSSQDAPEDRPRSRHGYDCTARPPAKFGRDKFADNRR